jgi:hypothetical protein
MARQGGCLCGALRCQVEGEPTVSGVCYCRTCRPASSAPALPFVVFPADQFAFTRGEPVRYRSSPHVVRTFCGRCGSPMTDATDDAPVRIDVMTCSLDDPEAFSPSHHVWASAKVAWHEIGDGLPVYPTMRTA